MYCTSLELSAITAGCHDLWNRCQHTHTSGASQANQLLCMIQKLQSWGRTACYLLDRRSYQPGSMASGWHLSYPGKALASTLLLTS